MIRFFILGMLILSVFCVRIFEGLAFVCVNILGGLSFFYLLWESG